MSDVRITIDGVEGTVPSRSTVLQAAELLGVRIPTLCNHPALPPTGSCRVCMVEIDKQRGLQPACTFPVSDGMVVHTHTDRVVESRRFVLQLLFSERNHYCMYCQMSGSCELQSLAYEYGLDHWEFDHPYPKYAVDASRQYFMHEPNRCILCRRCIRACEQLVGNATLGLKARGAHTEVTADLDVPFGDSSCVSCGTCLQVCPTGALADRASAYMGAKDEVTRVKSRCTACSVGCGVELVVRDGRVIRVDGDWDAAPNHGLICEQGRFWLLNESRARVQKPLVRTADGFRAVSWDEATAMVAEKIGAAGDGLETVVSGFASTEAGAEIVAGFPGRHTLMDGAAVQDATCDLAALDEADCIVLVGVDLAQDYQVAGFAVKRGVRNRSLPLLIVDEAPTGMDSWATIKTTPDHREGVLRVAGAAQSPVIVCQASSFAAATSLAADLPRSRVVCLAPGGNSLGLAKAGLLSDRNGAASAYYVLAGEAKAADEGLMERLKGATFVAVQAAYREPWDTVADVILPSPLMHEKNGTLVNAEGRTLSIVAAEPYAAPSEQGVIEKIVTELGSSS